MERLSLDAFKIEAETKKEEKNKELENLTGGVLGACHCNQCGGDIDAVAHWHIGRHIIEWVWI